MDLENQATIKKLSEEYGSENLMVVLGMPTDGLKIAVETLTKGDPSWAGPLAGVSLGLPVYHVLEEEIRDLIPSEIYEEKLKMMEIVLDLEKIESNLLEMRASNS
jgi:glycine reductase|tara:strand:+ start:904 stop:1218 length:315 start_codon:yes stop_codon:yes gene_type:complete